MSFVDKVEPVSNFHIGSARLRLRGDPVRMAIPIRIPRKRNMSMCCAEVRAGLKRKQSRLVPASSRPFGVGINRFNVVVICCNSSQISAMLSL